MAKWVASSDFRQPSIHTLYPWLSTSTCELASPHSLFQSSARAARHLWASSAATDRAIPKEWSTPRLEFGWTCALLSPEGGVCVRWCNVVPFQAAGQGISREDSAAQLGAERLQAAFRPRRNSQPSRADGVLLGSGPAPRFSCTWTVRVRRVRVLGGQGKYIWRVAIEGQQVG